jgi:hypothetical protein
VRTYDELGDPPTEVVRRDARYLIRPFRPSDTPGTLLEACAENIGTVRTAYFLTAVPQRTLTAQHVEASGSATPGTEACLWGDSGTSALRGTASAPVSWQVRHSDPADDSIETVRTVTATVLDETETPPPGLHVVVCMVNTGSGRATFEMDVIPT